MARRRRKYHYLFSQDRSPGRGTALVEMALAMVLLMLLVLGVLEFGILFRNYLSVSEAARAGCRSAALGSQTSVVYNRVMNAVSALSLKSQYVTGVVMQYRVYNKANDTWTGWQALGNGSTGYNSAPCDQNYDSQMKVTVTYSYPMVTGTFLSPAVGHNGSLTLSGISIMRREETP